MTMTNLQHSAIGFFVATVLWASVATVQAATWGGGSGDWDTDNWSLTGTDRWPGSAEYPAESIRINAVGNTVTVGNGDVIATSGTFYFDNGTLVVEGNGSLSFAKQRDWEDTATLIVRDTASVTNTGGVQSPDGKTIVLVGPDAGDNPSVKLTLTQLDITQSNGTFTGGGMAASTLNLNGGVFNKTGGVSADVTGNSSTLNVQGGTWNSDSSFMIDQQNANQDFLFTLSSGAVNISGDLIMDTRVGDVTQDRIVTISGGAFDVSGNLAFNKGNGNLANKDFAVVGSDATSITIGGIDASSAVINSAEFIFTPDAGGATPVTLDTTTGPDFSKFTLTLNNFSAAWGSPMSDIELFDIVGATAATPFLNLAEGASVTLNDGSTDHDFTLTYTGDDGNDIVLEAVTAGGPAAIELSADTIAEHATIGTAIGNLGMLNTNGTFTYSLPVYGDNAFFDLTGTDNSNLVTDAIFDYETDSTYDIRVVATKGADTVTNDVEITISNASDPAVALSSQDVDEDESVGTVVGTISTANPIGPYTYAYSFGGGTDDASFTIDGSNLKTAEVFDDSVKDSYAIKVVSTIQEAGVSGDGPGAGPFTNDFTVTVNNTDPAGVIQIDFGRDNQSPKIGFVSGGNWNTIHTDPHAEADAAVGDMYELKATNGPPSGITIGSWTGSFSSTSSNNQDGDSFTGTNFAAPGYDVLWAASAGASVGFTLSGFDAADTVAIRLAAAAGAGGDPNVADFMIAGSFGGDNLGDDFDVLANAQAASGAGTELTWHLIGSTSYTFVMDTATGNGGINGMIITVAPPRPTIFQFQ